MSKRKVGSKLDLIKPWNKVLQIRWFLAQELSLHLNMLSNLLSLCSFNRGRCGMAQGPHIQHRRRLTLRTMNDKQI
jgi:hypothetical protein